MNQPDAPQPASPEEEARMVGTEEPALDRARRVPRLEMPPRHWDVPSKELGLGTAASVADAGERDVDVGSGDIVDFWKCIR